MADKSDQKKSLKKDKNSSDKVTPQKPEETGNKEDLSEEVMSDIPGREQTKTRELKFSTFFKTILLLLLIGVLSWTIYYSHNTIQNNLLINNKIKETVEEISRIQAEQNKIKEAVKSFEDNDINPIREEQGKIKEAIKSFKNNSTAMEEFLNSVNDLKNQISVLQNEVKVLQVEISKKPDFLPPRQVEVDLPSQKSQAELLEIKKETETKIEKAEVEEKPEVKEKSNKDIRNEVINSIEDTAETIYQKTGDAFKWMKEKVF
tara:strand:+ start:8978 stop:9760 length:783 start_codon:yes stop_codon:yes gene_type:complete